MHQLFIPASFNEVIHAFHDIKDSNFKWFALEDGKVVLSGAWYDRLEGKAYFFITTDIQRKRWEFAKNLAKILNDDLGELLREEIKQHPNEDVENFWKSFLQKDFVGKMPTGVRLITHYDKIERLEFTNMIEIDPLWVVFGFATMFDSLKPHKDVKEFKPLDYRCCYRAQTDGSHTLEMFLEGSPIPLDFLRQVKTTVLPGIYHIVNGTRVKTDRIGRKYPEHPLVYQPDHIPAAKWI